MIDSVTGRVSAAIKALRGTPSAVTSRVGGLVRDWYAGAWQQNRELVVHKSERYYAVFACMTLIAGDIAKLPIKVVRMQDNGMWKEESGPLAELIRKPNGYQNRIQFIENWILSKMIHGNTYVLKIRGSGGEVKEMKVLDPSYVTVLVSDAGNVYYQLATDALSGISSDNVQVPASEIIHDRFNCLYHPLVGVSPLYAAALAASQGLSIQKNSVKLFNNGGQSPGIITAPGQIDEVDAERLKSHWESNYGGSDNAGKVAVLGSGLEFKSSAMTSVDAQLIDQLKWSAEVVCGTFHVPPYMIGVGSLPNANNVQALILQYYSQCLQILIESLELLLDEGAEVDEDIGYEFDVESLLRMDGKAMAEYLKNLKEASILTPDEGRAKIGYPPVKGGDTIYMQQQNYSLSALMKRDAKEDPFSTKEPAAETPEPPASKDDDDQESKEVLGFATKSFAEKMKSLAIGGKNIEDI
jgi:HK97 family phage portal protein